MTGIDDFVSLGNFEWNQVDENYTAQFVVVRKGSERNQFFFESSIPFCRMALFEPLDHGNGFLRWGICTLSDPVG